MGVRNSSNAKRPKSKSRRKKRKSGINRIFDFLSRLTKLSWICIGILTVVLTALFIHFVYLPEGYYFWEELPSSRCRSVDRPITLSYKISAAGDTANYEEAFNGEYGCINYFGVVKLKSQPDSEAEVVTNIPFGARIGIFGEQEGDYYFCKYADNVSGRTFSGYLLTEYVSKEALNSPKIYLDVPRYMQTDSRWANIQIGGYETLESAGCTTTCLAMAYSCIRKETVLPSDMVEELRYDYDGNLSFPDEFIRYRSNAYLNDIYKQLSKGVPVLVGCFRPSGFPHWCVVYGYNGDGETMKKEDFMIYDPYSTERNNLKDFFSVFTDFNKIAYYNVD